MSKKVVLINQSTGYLMIDIVNAYASRYDEVVLLAGSVKVTERNLSPKIRLKQITAYNRTSSIKRILTWVWGSLQIFFLLLFRYRAHEIVYVTNPPMAYLSSLLLKRNYSLIIYDIYPDALKNIGISEKNFFYRFWQNANKKIFAHADKIITLSENMADLLNQYISKEHIKVVSNWSASENFKPIEKKNNPFIVENHLENKFIVLYSGNIGYTHNIELIPEIAEKLQEFSHIHFVIIGEGKKKPELIKQTKELQLTNCTFLTWQPAALLPYSLSSADLAVVTLNNESGHQSVPSKTYNLLAVGAPLLCLAPLGTELDLLVQKYENGSCFTKNQQEEIINFILSLSENEEKRKQLSLNSLKAASGFHYSNALQYL